MVVILMILNFFYDLAITLLNLLQTIYYARLDLSLRLSLSLLHYLCPPRSQKIWTVVKKVSVLQAAPLVYPMSLATSKVKKF